ncbi:hypothetical protein T484DRAFT_3057358 [Baffinella frigidus]|nr:hypothetical protein T484DRAFT_3057358 [Cryptophyta sp. CCMP2293]
MEHCAFRHAEPGAPMAPTDPSAASLGFTDHPQVDMLGAWYKSVNFGAGTSPGPPNSCTQIDRDRAARCTAGSGGYRAPGMAPSPAHHPTPARPGAVHGSDPRGIKPLSSSSSSGSSNSSEKQPCWRMTQQLHTARDEAAAPGEIFAIRLLGSARLALPWHLLAGNAKAELASHYPRHYFLPRQTLP